MSFARIKRTGYSLLTFLLLKYKAEVKISSKVNAVSLLQNVVMNFSLCRFFQLMRKSMQKESIRPFLSRSKIPYSVGLLIKKNKSQIEVSSHAAQLLAILVIHIYLDV